MTVRRPKRGDGAAPRARKTRSRQRQRLIDACISALHIYGPSRTTVAKVVAIAKMSPGIVRFYFDSKAAMLVASLQFLAAEFEEQLLIPVARLKSTPVAALARLVDLYLDPEIASPRKVSVWYAFWGEASSRQEYYDICGQKDESFAVLVRELIEGLVLETGQPHLEAGGIALGLIGALEILWQDFAFRTERDLDRAAAKERCMAYLRSIFPGQFAGRAAAPSPVSAAAAAPRVAGSAYADARIHALERDRLFRDAWTVAGHESQLAHPGDFLTIDTALERVLLVRGASGQVHALRNSCPAYPHRLVAPAGGRFESRIECRVHGLEFSLDGRCQGTTRSPLRALDLSSSGGLLLVRCADPAHGAAERAGWVEDAVPQGLAALTAPLEAAVAADWKVLVEQWLAATRGREPRPSGRPWPAPLALAWEVPVLAAADWSARRYRNLVGCSVERTWRRLFIAPNQLIETRPDGLSVLQAVPVAPGRSLLRRLDYSAPGPQQAARGALYLARRLGGQARRAALELAESIQRGLADFAYAVPAGDAPEAVAWFHDLVAAAVPALARHPPPSDN